MRQHCCCSTFLPQVLLLILLHLLLLLLHLLVFLPLTSLPLPTPLPLPISLPLTSLPLPLVPPFQTSFQRPISRGFLITLCFTSTSLHLSCVSLAPSLEMFKDCTRSYGRLPQAFAPPLLPLEAPSQWATTQGDPGFVILFLGINFLFFYWKKHKSKNTNRKPMFTTLASG